MIDIFLYLKYCIMHVICSMLCQINSVKFDMLNFFMDYSVIHKDKMLFVQSRQITLNISGNLIDFQYGYHEYPG